jgi:hypothetical protein
MSQTEDEFPRGAYRICGYTHSNEDDLAEWFTLELRLNGTIFHIRVFVSNFHNSPARTKEFYKYFAFLSSDVEEYDGEEDNMDDNEHDTQGITVSECFHWATKSFLPVFQHTAPQPTFSSTVTLQQFLACKSLECDLGAVNDELRLGEMEERDPGAPFIESGFGVEVTLRITSFPSFPPSQVEIISQDPEYILTDAPTRVLVGGQYCFFKTLDGIGEALGVKETTRHEQILQAHFGPDVRTSSLFGVVQDEGHQLLGLFLYYIESSTLWEAVKSPETTQGLKERWARQIQDTLASLHRAGIVCGDAKPDNIIIDVYGDARTIDFGGGYTEGWVDKEKARTIEGDLQGLRNILDFLSGDEMGCNE